MVVICPNCGFDENPEGTEFCEACGAELSSETEVVICRRCGFDGNPEDTEFCEACGAELFLETKGTVAVQPQPQPLPSSMPLPPRLHGTSSAGQSKLKQSSQTLPSSKFISAKFISGSSITPEYMLEMELQQIEQWAKDNRRDAKLDSIKFWLLKVPAIIVSASSGIFSYFQLDTASVIASGVASAIVILDGLLRPGSLRDAHYLAFIELRSLENEIVSEWHRRNLVGEDSHLIVSTLIERIQEERKRISRYLKTKEVPSVLES